MRAAALIILLSGCSSYDELVSTDAGFVMKLRGAQFNHSMVLRSLTPSGGWAELIAPNGTSCGRSPSVHSNGLPVRHSDFMPTNEPFSVSWSTSSVSVGGVAGYWTLDPCRYVEPPNPFY